MDDLRLLILSRHPIVYVETFEEERLGRMVEEICRGLELPYFVWSVTRGLRRAGVSDPVPETEAPGRMLAYVRSLHCTATYLLSDFHPYLADAGLVRALREVAQESAEVGATLVLCSPQLTLPPELAKLAARFVLRLPGPEELRAEVVETLRGLAAHHRVRNRLRAPDLDQLVRNLSGLTLGEVHRLIARSVLDDGVLDADDLPRVLEAKRQRLEETGLLELCATDGSASPLGGLGHLKGWLQRVQSGFTERARELGLRPPRGVLLTGVQGCGKSLAARAIARQWQLPLVRLDPGRLFDKFVGESEKNLRQALAAAEAMAPVVLWIDEIEKAFAGGVGAADADAGLGRRLFGSFLTWMQERSAAIFLVATANEPELLPAELLRKGRFDEVFFLDLPTPEERREIWQIHLRLRKQDPALFELELLTAASEGFSGAEIEQAVVTALYGLLAEGGEALDTKRLLDELAATVPLSQSRHGEITALRALARERFVAAS